MKSKEIVFGTKNPAKIEQVRGILSPLGINVVGLDGFENIPEVTEDGLDVVQNAILKATSYARAIGKTVFSMDNGLYFEGIPDAQQPGTRVRRIEGEERSSDDDLLAHYVVFINKHGGSMKANWRYGLALAKPDGDYASTSLVNPRIFSGKPCKAMMPGYPLESLQIDPSTGEYVAEMTEGQRAAYWQRVIGRPLVKFVIENI